MKCENVKCTKEHDGSFGSGRFCSASCSLYRDFSKSLAYRNKNMSHSDISKSSWDDDRKLSLKLKSFQKIMSSDFDSICFDSKRKRILVEQEGRCNRCGIYEWLSEQISLEIDHINGDSNDDSRGNMEALCPNCHSLTKTWRGRNKSNTSKRKVTDDEIIEAYKQSKNIRQTLLLLGLAGKGGNYSRVKYLIQSLRGVS